MVRLHVLGTLDLTGPDGSEPQAILAQPKPLALLVYLAVRGGPGYRRRDELLGLLWPETTSVRGRRALSQALHVLRSSLGSDVIDARGTDEVRASPATVSCDAVEFRALVESGQLEDAMALYSGDFLPSFFADDAPGFEDWASRERQALRDLAASASWRLSERGDAESNVAIASMWAHRAVELAPYDERGVRRLMQLLSRSGDRAGAVRAYNDLAARLSRDLEVEPSAESRAALDAVRSRDETIEVTAAPSPLRAPESAQPAGDSLTAQVPRGSSVHVQRSKRARRVAILTGAIAIAAAVIGSMMFRGRAPSPRQETAVAGGREEILIAQFDGAPADSSLADVVTEAVRLDLSQSPRLRVVSTAKVRDALRLMRRDTTLRPDSRVAREIAERDGIKAVLEGDIRRSAGSFMLSARLVNASTGELIDGWRTTAVDSAAIIRAVDQLTGSVRQRVGESLQSIKAASPLLAITTSSLPALRKHAMGLSAFYEEDFARAAALYEEAIVLDSTFADAYLGLVGALGQLGAKPARQIEATILAYKFRNQLGDAERYGVEGNYLARVKGDRDAAIDAYINQGRLTTEAYWGSLASLLIQARRYAEAERTLTGALEGYSTPIMYYHLAHARHAQRKTAMALATLDSAAAKYPNRSIFVRTRIEMAASEGRVEQADSMAHAVAASRSGPFPVRHQALLDATRGELSEALEHLQSLRGRQLASGAAPASFATFLMIQRLVLHVRGDSAAAIKEVESALSRREFHAIDPRERPYPSLAHFFVEANRPVRAQQLLEEYVDKVPVEFRAFDRSVLARTKAMLEMIAGRQQSALAALKTFTNEEAFPHPALADLAWAYERAGDASSARAAYARYIETPGLARIEADPFYLKKALSRAVLLSREQGRTADAARYQARLSRLWRGADQALRAQYAATSR